MLKPSVSQPYVVCGESLSRAVVHGLRVVELRVVTWYMSNIRVKWVQLLKVYLIKIVCVHGLRGVLLRLRRWVSTILSFIIDRIHA